MSKAYTRDATDAGNAYARFVPTGELWRWRNWSSGEVEVPSPLVIRCARCGFTMEGELEEARAAYRTHECEQRPAVVLPTP